ncbi:hypothetical protein [Tunicatimonas pelagia]|uniref:hypothetical protein n=1 Tax=Tunicatimonas pelagia TaxID=931531 RepID=UPI00345D6A87
MPVAYAQENPYLVAERPFVGGGLTVRITDLEDANNSLTNQITDESSSFGISPTYGKFISNRWAVGVSLSITSTDEKRISIQNGSTRTSINNRTTIGITPFFRRFIPITERFGAFLQPQLSYAYQIGSIEDKFSDPSDPANNTGSSFINQGHRIGLGMIGGLYYFINRHFSLETNLLDLNFAYNIENRENTNSSAPPDNDRESSWSNLQINLINQLRLNQIIVFNYYF